MADDAQIIAPEAVPTSLELSQQAAANPLLNSIGGILASLPQGEYPLVHRFTPGLYTREVHVPAGHLVLTKIHKTEHPFVVLQGEASVWTEDAGVVHVKAGHLGITKPGTRRLVYCRTDVVWATFHPSEETDLMKLEAQLIYPHENVPTLTAEEVAQLTQGQKENLS